LRPSKSHLTGLCKIATYVIITANALVGSAGKG
jgi:hypothetical protein